MKKIVFILTLSLLFQPSMAQAHSNQDPFTIFIQEKLIAMGILEGEPTGINDKATQQAIKTFQEKSGLIVDGMVGDNTFQKIILGEKAYHSTSSISTQSEEPAIDAPAGTDIEPPVWDNDQSPYASNIGSLFNLHMPSVVDNVGIVSYEVYVNGALSNHVIISDSILLVTPKYDMACADQIIYVVAFDENGNSSKSPSFIIPQSDPCISVPPTNETNTNETYFAISFGGAGSDVGYGLDVDSSGNTYVTGYFQETVNFGGGNITSAGSSDIFVLKLDSSGKLLWVNTYGGTGDEAGIHFSIDSSGNIYVSGNFGDTVDFGGGNVTSAGSADIFILKLNSSGAFQWVNTYGGTGYDTGNGLDVDSSGNIYVSGYFGDTVDFGGGNVTTAGNSDIFVLKLNSSGAFQWVNTYGDTGFDVSEDTVIDSSGNLYIIGSFQNTVDFGGGNITSAGSNDIYVLKLNSLGRGIE